MIFSYYRLYQDKYLEAESNLSEHKQSLDKRLKVLDTLVDPFRFVSEVGIGFPKSWGGNNNTVVQPADYTKQDLTEFQIADKVEGIVKNTFSKY